jgi:hypothetical protein
MDSPWSLICSSAMSSALRYQGKPILKFLESYVLWAIGQLSTPDAETLKDMTPTLRSIFGIEGDWPQVISAVMELPPNMPSLIRELWAKNTEIARRNGKVLTPQQFAEMSVDQNLHSLDPL